MNYIDIDLSSQAKRNARLVAGVQEESFVNGVRFIVPSEFDGWTVAVDVENAGGEKHRFEIADVVDGVATYEFTASDLAHKGQLHLDIIFIDGKHVAKPWSGEFAVKQAICANDLIAGKLPIIMTSGMSALIQESVDRLKLMIPPTVSIEEVEAGHNVTITDVDHKEGQSFYVRDGVDGFSPSVTVEEDGHRHIVTIVDADHPDGIEVEILDGERGVSGLSAYDVAVANGFSGSVAEWLLSLVGPQGQTGDVGAEGKSAYTVAVENGFSGSVFEWLASLKGDKGDTGATGDKGDKGDKGDTGAQGIQGVQGEKGDKGDTGAKGDKGDKGDTGLTGAKGDKGDTGSQGIQGKSAYEVAVDGGYVGTVAEWLLSLKGANGQNGTDGANGTSPTVAVSTITGGHRITITDIDHPNGVAVDIMDGVDGSDADVAGEAALRSAADVELGQRIGAIETWMSNIIDGSSTLFPVEEGDVE